MSLFPHLQVPEVLHDGIVSESCDGVTDLSSETPVLARRNHREFEFPGCIGRCVYAKADAVPRILSARRQSEHLKALLWLFVADLLVLDSPTLRGGQR